VIVILSHKGFSTGNRYDVAESDYI